MNSICNMAQIQDFSQKTPQKRPKTIKNRGNPAFFALFKAKKYAKNR